MANDKLLLDYGSGGQASHRLISGLFFKHFDNPALTAMNDAAVLDLQGPIAMSTDTFTVDPIFFPGGDIGSLAVHGTVNDVAMLGAIPKYLSCGFILEEGLEMEILERVVISMAQAAREAGVAIVTGDTKVVPKGAVDKIFINTTGVGSIISDPAPSGDRAAPGDVILISGTLGDHGLTVLAQREGLAFASQTRSDAASLNHMIKDLLEGIGTSGELHVLRDPTRGGLATTLNEIAGQSGVVCQISEDSLPVNPLVADGCSFLGLDPLYLANEGKLLCILPENLADKALDIMRATPIGGGAVIIGRVQQAEAPTRPGQVILETRLGGRRLLHMLEGEQLPRIC